MELGFDEITRVTGGRWHGTMPQGAVRAVSTDTRTLPDGALFVALRGENLDGHRFLDRADNAAALVVDEAGANSIPDGRPALVVSDTLRALGDIAACWRTYCPARRIGVVGSSGKTTTKNMLASLLAKTGATHATEANFNNLIGVPWTLFGLEESHDFCVLEMGMNEPGELARLTEIADPEMLLLLNVGTAHAGQFESLDALVEAKAESVRQLSPDATIVYDADSANTCRIVRQYAEERRLVSFSTQGPADGMARDIAADPPAGYRVYMDFGKEAIEGTVPLFGRHNVANALAAASAACTLGVSTDVVAAGLAGLQSAPMRAELRSTAGVSLVVDCYNANPDSMQAALGSLAEWRSPEGRLWLVLGEMGELGALSEQAHHDVGETAVCLRPSGVLLIGEGTRPIEHACSLYDIPVEHFGAVEDLSDRLCSDLRAGDTVFFKGSRSNHLEAVVDAAVAHLERQDTSAKQ